MAINIPALPGTAATAQPWRLRLAGEGKEAQKPQRWLKHSGSWAMAAGSYWLLLGQKKSQDAQAENLASCTVRGEISSKKHQ